MDSERGKIIAVDIAHALFQVVFDLCVANSKSLGIES
jgi:hypothetical protein